MAITTNTANLWRSWWVMVIVIYRYQQLTSYRLLLERPDGFFRLLNILYKIWPSDLLFVLTKHLVIINRWCAEQSWTIKLGLKKMVWHITFVWNHLYAKTNERICQIIRIKRLNYYCKLRYLENLYWWPRLM